MGAFEVLTRCAKLNRANLKLRENEYNANFNTSKVNLKIAITVSIYIPCDSDAINISFKQSSILNKNYDKRKYSKTRILK